MCLTSWLSLSLSLAPSLHMGGHCLQITDTLLYLYKGMFYFLPLNFFLFFLTGARSRHIPDVPITFHSWIHLNPPLPRSSVFDTRITHRSRLLYTSACCNKLKNKYPFQSHRTRTQTRTYSNKLVPPWVQHCQWPSEGRDLTLNVLMRHEGECFKVIKVLFSWYLRDWLICPMCHAFPFPSIFFFFLNSLPSSLFSVHLVFINHLHSLHFCACTFLLPPQSALSSVFPTVSF